MASKKLVMNLTPWKTSKLFFRADEPGQKEPRAAMLRAVTEMKLSPSAATYLTWLWLVEVHGGDDQGGGS